MIDTSKYENMRRLFLDFIGTASDEVDEEAWRDKLTMLDELLAEIKRLRRAFRIATAHIGFGNHLGHAELRRALNSMGIDYNSLPWADEEWEEPLPTFGGVAHYD
jgi:predicted LPLAT superfamily acyltransferase